MCIIGEARKIESLGSHNRILSRNNRNREDKEEGRGGRLSGMFGIMAVRIILAGISCKNDLRIIIRLSERRLLCHYGHVALRIARVARVLVALCACTDSLRCFQHGRAFMVFPTAPYKSIEAPKISDLRPGTYLYFRSGWKNDYKVQSKSYRAFFTSLLFYTGSSSETIINDRFKRRMRCNAKWNIQEGKYTRVYKMLQVFVFKLRQFILWVWIKREMLRKRSSFGSLLKNYNKNVKYKRDNNIYHLKSSTVIPFQNVYRSWRNWHSLIVSAFSSLSVA